MTLPEDHALYKSYKPSVKNATVTDLLRSCTRFEIFPGTNSKELCGGFIVHSIPMHSNYQSDNAEDEDLLTSYQSYTITRQRSCKPSYKSTSFQCL